MQPAGWVGPILAFWLCASIPAFAQPSNSKAAERTCVRKSFRIVLDVGHTAATPGAISARGIPEFDFNLALAQTVGRVLHETGFHNTHVKIRVREDLSERAREINSLAPDLVISIHHDSVQNRYLKLGPIDGEMRSYSQHASGYSIFVSHDNSRRADSENFARILGHELRARNFRLTMHHAENIPGENRPVIDAKIGVFRFDRLVILRQTTAPAVLFEAAVIINPDDELRAASEPFRRSVADSIAQAVLRFCAGAGPVRLSAEPRPANDAAVFPSQESETFSDAGEQPVEPASGDPGRAPD